MDHYNTSSLNRSTVESNYLGNLAIEAAVQTMIKKPGKHQIKVTYVCLLIFFNRVFVFKQILLSSAKNALYQIIELLCLFYINIMM